MGTQSLSTIKAPPNSRIHKPRSNLFFFFLPYGIFGGVNRVLRKSSFWPRSTTAIFEMSFLAHNSVYLKRDLLTMYSSLEYFGYFSWSIAVLIYAFTAL
ncbi:hypothetical protein HOY80DRAFT_943732 [Tuber brumale]|nr:hypothetical protein HOY80DRAFT_943732 [Tuber brumale]